MAVQSVATPANSKRQENNGAFDTTTLWRLWEAQSIVALIREALESEEVTTKDERVTWALKGAERLLDSAIVRGGENSALEFDSEG